MIEIIEEFRKVHRIVEDVACRDHLKSTKIVEAQSMNNITKEKIAIVKMQIVIDEKNIVIGQTKIMIGKITIVNIMKTEIDDIGIIKAKIAIVKTKIETEVSVLDR